MSFEPTQFDLSGFPFDSTDFAMTTASPMTVLPAPIPAMDWEDNHESGVEEENAPIEVDPDLEDEETLAEVDPFEENVKEDDDDDEFEEYMLGDDD